MYIPKTICCFQRKNNLGGCSLKAFLTYKHPDGSIPNEKTINDWIKGSFYTDYTPVNTEFENIPISNLEIVTTVGGGSGDIRQAYIEIHDPRGFNVEITDECFIDICKNSTVSKGIILDEYVYAFYDHRIALVKLESEQYYDALDEGYRFEESFKYNEEISAKDFVQGRVYRVNCSSGNATYSKYLPAVYIGKTYKTDYYGANKSVRVFLVMNDPYNKNCTFSCLTKTNIIRDTSIQLYDSSTCNQLITDIGYISEKAYGRDLTNVLNKHKNTILTKDNINTLYNS